MDYLTKRLVAVCSALALMSGGHLQAGEHPGKEHGGKPAKEHAGEKAATFTASQIKKAMQGHINKEIKNHGGVFLIKDPKQGNVELRLKFVKIHDPVRQIEGKGYFACTDFEVVGEPGKLYDLDFWLNPRDGQLAVTETKIHKEPKLVDGQWAKTARYTFVNDKPVDVP